MKNCHRNQLRKIFRKIIDSAIILSLVLSMLNLPHIVYASPETILSNYTNPNPLPEISASHPSGIHIDEVWSPYSEIYYKFLVTLQHMLLASLRVDTLEVHQHGAV